MPARPPGRRAAGWAAVVLLAGMASFLAGCGPLASPPANADRSTGARLYVADGCAGCHQVNGVGGRTANSLTDDFAGANFDLLTYYLQHPPQGMAYVRRLHLTARSIADMSAFIGSSLKPPASASAGGSLHPASSSSAGSSTSPTATVGPAGSPPATAVERDPSGFTQRPGHIPGRPCIGRAHEVPCRGLPPGPHAVRH